MKPIPSTLLWRALWALLLVVAVFTVYGPVYDAGFIWDDDDYLILNPLLTEEGALGEIWDPTSPRNPQFYPLVFTSFRLERSLWGLDPAGYHTVNVALHALNVVLLLLLLWRIGAPAAWLVAALFALHPIYVESVAWVAERKNVLSGLFYLLAALSYLRFDRTSRARWYLVALFCFILALSSKTITASLPIALGLILWYERRPLTRARLLTLAGMLAVGFAMGTLTRLHEYRHVLVGGGGEVFAELSFIDRILIAGRAFWFYLAKIIWPSSLAFFYSRWAIDPRQLIQWLYPAAGLAAAILLLLRRKRRGPLAAGLFYAATIFPALGFVNVAPMRFSFVADHFQYLASLGGLLLVGGAGAWLGRRCDAVMSRSNRIFTCGLLTVFLLGTLFLMTNRQSRIYHDLGTLWEDTAQKAPGNWVVQINRGVWLKQQGDEAGAAECYARAIALSPPPSEAAIIGYSNLASVRFRQNRFAESLAAADSSLAISPGHPLGLLNRGRALTELGRPEEAEATLRALLSAVPDPAAGRAAWDIRRRLDEWAIFRYLALSQARQGKLDDALASFGRAIAEAPDNAVLHSERLGLLHQNRRFPEAIAASRLAARAVAENAPFLMELALLLSVAPDSADRRGPEALELATALVRKFGDREPQLMSVMAAAQAAVGQFAAAQATARRALEVAERTGNQTMVTQLRAQLGAFAEGRCLYYGAQ